MIERKKYIDYSKGIGILLIIFAHSIQYFKTMTIINNFVCSFHVPIFFIAGGFLAWIKRDKNFNFGYICAKRARTLLIPYVIYSLFNSILKFGVLLLGHSLSREKIYEELIALLITGNGTVWFLVTLYAVEILFCLLSVRVKRGYSLLAVIFLILPYLIYPFMQNPFGIVFIRIIAGFGFYLAGYCVCSWIENYSIKIKDILLVFILIAGIISYMIFKSNYSFFEGRFDAPVWSVIPGLFLSIGVIFISIYFENHISGVKLIRILEYFGKNFLVVMLIHPTILLLFTYLLAGKFWNLEGVGSVIVAFLLFIIIALLEIPTIYIVNRWFGWTLGRFKKGENNG